MKVVILAGGLGTRITEESKNCPKPLIQIGDRPILWHIMKRYSMYGFNDFVICCGYKGNMIKEYFTKYYMKYNDVTFNMKSGGIEYHNNQMEPWKITMVNTGLRTKTAGRILNIKDYIGDEDFMLTYGDGVADINIDKLLEFHNKNDKCLTITVTKPQGRFGGVQINEKNGTVQGFREKARDDQSYINIGFMVCKNEIFNYLGDGSDMLEASPFEKILAEGEMDAYIHDGFWAPMDNVMDKAYLTSLWENSNAVWLK